MQVMAESEIKQEIYEAIRVIINSGGFNVNTGNYVMYLPYGKSYKYYSDLVKAYPEAFSVFGISILKNGMTIKYNGRPVYFEQEK